MKTPFIQPLVATAVAGVALLPTPAAAEATWADFILLLPKLILFGLPLEIAQFCYHLWPLMVGFAVLSWVIHRQINGRDRDTNDRHRLPLLFRPVVSTSLAIFMILVAIVATVTVEKAHLKNSRFAISNLMKAFSPTVRAVEKPKPIVPFVLSDGRAWPKVAAELAGAGQDNTKHAGSYALEIENLLGKSSVYAKLCADQSNDCQAIRTMFIPSGTSITIRELAAGSYRLHYRSVDDQRLAARSRPFDLPGESSFFSAHSGAGAVPKTPQVGNGSFEHGDESAPARIKLPGFMASMEFNPVNALFRLIRAEEF